MNTLKNLAKKAIAVGSGAMLLGVTAMGAMAQTTTATTLDLANYPAPFIKSGQFDGLLVVGEKAKTEDVLGAIEIAAALQASSTTPVSGGGGSGTTTTLSGDVKQVASSGDMLEIGEQLGSVVESLTEDDLELLQDGSVTTQSGTTDFEQTLRLDSAAGSAVVLLDENNDDVTGTYLFWNDGAQLFDYDLEFTSGLESDVDSDGNAEDIEDESIFMLGNYYTVVNTDVTDDAGADDVTIELIAGDVTDTLAEGETATYTIDGKDYEITVLVIGTNNNDATVKFVVNGEVTDSMVDGDTETLSDGLEIGVRDIIETTAYRESDPSSIVEFYLGANKVEIADLDVQTVDGGASVEINSENIEDARADIEAIVTGAATDVRINAISYALDVDAAFQTDVFLSEGEGVREALDEPEGMIGNWDIVYQGLSAPEMTDVELDSQGDDQYNLVFQNLRGQEFNVPLAYAGGAGASDGTYGDEDDSFIFTERDANADGDADVDADFNIGLDDYFALTDVGGTGTADNGDDSYILQFTDVDEDDSTVSFENIGDGSEIKATYTPTGAFGDAPGVGVTGDITIGGKDFGFELHEDGTDGYRLAVDLDNSGSLENNSVLDIVVNGGGILTLSDNAVAAHPAADGWAGTNFNMTLTTDADDVDNDTTQSTLITVTETTVDLDVDFSSSNAGGAGVWFYDDDSDADTETGLNGYGTWFKKTDDTDEADDLIISYPEEQLEAMVYVTGGEVKKSTSTGSTGGSSRVNRISVGSAVLDKDVTYDQDNMIVVGGPCVNTIAAALMQNPADCTEGFSEGHAWLKLFDTGKNTALLVAGYGAQDTQGASRVLAEYGDYDLSGAEADVVVESLTNIMVK